MAEACVDYCSDGILMPAAICDKYKADHSEYILIPSDILYSELQVRSHVYLEILVLVHFAQVFA